MLLRLFSFFYGDLSIFYQFKKGYIFRMVKFCFPSLEISNNQFVFSIAKIKIKKVNLVSLGFFFALFLSLYILAFENTPNGFKVKKNTKF
jgi:hypothetical protein